MACPFPPPGACSLSFAKGTLWYPLEPQCASFSHLYIPGLMWTIRVCPSCDRSGQRHVIHRFYQTALLPIYFCALVGGGAGWLCQPLPPWPRRCLLFCSIHIFQMFPPCCLSPSSSPLSLAAAAAAAAALLSRPPLRPAVGALSDAHRDATLCHMGKVPHLCIRPSPAAGSSCPPPFLSLSSL